MEALRPSFTERDSFREALVQAYAEGRLDDAEFTARIDLVERAVTIEELLIVMDGLPIDKLVLPEGHPRPPALLDEAPIEPTPGQRWKRRGFLAVGAAVVGFITAGGVGKAVALLPPIGPVPVGLPGVPMDTFAEGGNARQLEWLAGKGYQRFEEFTLHGDAFYATAVVPGREDALDDISMVRNQTPTIRARGQRKATDFTFTVDDVDLGVIPEIVRVAPGVLGGASVTHVIIDEWEGEVSIRPYVDGDAYGAGSGYLVWSADGQRLIRIVR